MVPGLGCRRDDGGRESTINKCGGAVARRNAPRPDNALTDHVRIPKPVCVLIVEDEPLILETMAEGFRDAGYDVVEATNGLQAVALLADPPVPYIILVTDLHMPGGIDGSQVASRLRTSRPEIPVIIATGRPDAMKQSWRDDLGYVMLRKPYLAADLIKLVGALAGPPRNRTP